MHPHSDASQLMLRRIADNLFERRIGFHLYGLAAAALGLVGIVWGDFALVWQPVPAAVPGRTILAYMVGAALLSAGAAMQWRRTAVLGAEALTTLYALGVLLLHVPQVARHPMIFAAWAGLAEQLALVAGGLTAYAAAARIDAALAARLSKVGCVTLGVCLFGFGLAHFIYAEETAAYVPKWIPPGQNFWAYATGILHCAAGAAILSGIYAKAAAKWLTAMFVGFGVLVHAPSLFIDPHSHMNWTANAMNLALIGAAWIIAESMAKRGANGLA
jgi:uncharacterized membrane protein YphA (DoxX/SURF4 family)